MGGLWRTGVEQKMLICPLGGVVGAVANRPGFDMKEGKYFLPRWLNPPTPLSQFRL